MRKSFMPVLFFAFFVITSNAIYALSDASMLRNPTMVETEAFIKKYLSETNVSTICVVAADNVREAAEQSGLKCGKICVRFRHNGFLSQNSYGGGNHAFNFFDTSDCGIVWFDSQKNLCLPSRCVSLETFLQIEYGDITLLGFYISSN
jgi:hypothetical protein